MMPKAIFFLCCVWLSGVSGAWADDGGCGGKCSRRCADAVGKLTLPKIEIHNSGRDGDMIERQRAAAEIIYAKIARSLGLAVPDMVIKSLTASDMAALSANSGHPAPHAVDGAAVVENSFRSGNILEFVETGRESHVQYLRDRNTFEETLIVFAHVVGHYDFAETSHLFRVRDGDRIRDSYELATTMTKLYLYHDQEEVDRFYQYLLSIRYLQDLSRSSFTPPEDFRPKPQAGLKAFHSNRDPMSFNRSEETGVLRKHPGSPTPNVLQSFVYNLSESAPDYQKDLIKKFERLHRVAPAIMATKIMNEGWATLMEYMILSHSPWNDGAHLVEFAGINAGVTVPSLSNPYWLGLQAWLRIRERFLERPEIQKLSHFEQDKAFIAFAREELIQKHTDYTFLKFALDEAWVEKWNLFLYREAGELEGVAPGEKNVAISRRANRVVDFIANRYANFDFKQPRIMVEDFDLDQTGRVLLKHHEVGGIPLRRDSVAKTLFVIAQILRKPVVLDALGTNRWFVRSIPEEHVAQLQAMGRLSPEYRNNSHYEYRYRVQVTPQGDVQVTYDRSDSQIVGADKLEAQFKNAIEAYQADLSVSYDSRDKSSARFEDYARLVLEGAKGSGPSLNIMGHAPTAAQAVFKYQQTVERRLAEILKRAVAGKWPLRQTADGKNLVVRVMPDIPEFALDWRVYSQKMKDQKPTPSEASWDRQLLSFNLFANINERQSQKVLIPDEDLDVGSGPYQPGDLWDKPKPGDGEAEGEGEEAEEGEPGEGAGEGGGEGESDDPSLIKIPMDLFGRMIAEQLELKNVRITDDGENPMESERRAAAAARPSGHLREERTFEKVLEKGIAFALGEGRDIHAMTVEDLYLLGLKHFEPEDIVVWDHELVMRPQMDAVIVYVADTSGSMGPEHRLIERKMVAFTSAVLKTIYPALKEKFVIYDSEAKEVSRSEFFERSLGGGTETNAGLKVVEKILEKFPEARYNRYVQLFSDGGDFKPEEAAAKAKELARKVEFFAYGHIAPQPMPMDYAPLSQAFAQLAQEVREKIGYAELSSQHASLVEALKRYYGKQKEE